VGIRLFRVLTRQQLEPGGAKEHPAHEQCQVLIAGHKNPSIWDLFARWASRSVLFVLVAGEDHHCHAEHGRPGPKPMMLHKITSCMEISYSPLIYFHITAFREKSQE
jgi:hypothetical protein